MTNLIDMRQVNAEIEARYGSRHAHSRTRRDSSLEIMRRTMRRRTWQELHPGTTPNDV